MLEKTFHVMKGEINTMAVVRDGPKPFIRYKLSRTCEV